MDLIIIGCPRVSMVGDGKEGLIDCTQKGRGVTIFRLTESEDSIINRGLQITLACHTQEYEPTYERTICVDSTPKSQRRRARKRGWLRLQMRPSNVDPGCQMIAYLLLSRNERSASIVLYPKPDTASFLGRIPDETSVADLALPGTHDTCAFFGVPISQCQQPSTPLSRQLLDGIRFLDIRCRVVKGELIVFHGVRNQRTTFVSVLADLRNFLENHPTEMVIMSIKDEQRHDDFSRLVWLDMAEYPDAWFLENRVPTLGEVRGKAIIMGRFWTSPDDDNWDHGMGWRIPGWGPPVKNLQFNCGGTEGILQDWYTLSSFLEIPEKLAITTEVMQLQQSQSQAPKLTISYASASGYPLAPPFAIAKGFGWPEWGFGIEGINSRLEGWLIKQLSEGKKVRGIIPLDFYRQTNSGGDGNICELLVLMSLL